MKLVRADIENFRSIESQRIDFSPACLVLVGINECGKSNLLRALSLLKKDEISTKDDIRFTRDNEEPITSAFVRFVFQANDAEFQQIFAKFREKVVGIDPKAALFKNGAKKLTLEEFCSQHRQVLWNVNLINQQKSFNWWRVDDHELMPGWFQPVAGINLQITVAPGVNRPIAEFLLIHDTVNAFPANSLQPVTVEKIAEEWAKVLYKQLETNFPETIYWTYDEKYLLPPSLNLPQFAVNPMMCVPLKHLFELAGYVDIQKSVTEQRAINHGIRNMLKRVSNRANEYLHAVWKDDAKVKIELVPNADNIDIAVVDHYNHFAPNRRSDGFKRLLTFLFMIASRVKAGKLNNAIILIDEPEIGLHPSGTKSLRDELIAMGENNSVVFSTHSIFMIDRDCIGRHIVVKKENELTVAKVVTEGSVTDEEVIYNALGYSIFESLKEINLIFEGWRDKKLFQVATGRAPKKYKALVKAFDKVGLCHVKGVKDVRAVAPLLELANRKCIILSDDDAPAREQKREHEKHRKYGEWLTYSDMLPVAGIITGEDFVHPEAFEQVIQKVRELNPGLPEFGIKDLSVPGGKIAALRKWLGKDADTTMDFIKGNVFENLNSAHISDVYYEYLAAVKKKISSDGKV